MFALSEVTDVRPIVHDYSSLARASRFNLDSRVADGFDQEALQIAFQGCDVVVHAVAGDIKTILGTLTPVYQAAQKAGVAAACLFEQRLCPWAGSSTRYG